MDVSKEYISQCEKAVEIQKKEIIFAEWPSDIVIINGDWWFYKGADTGNYKKIWLPRQDQLQEMVKDTFEDMKPLSILKSLYLQENLSDEKYLLNFTSMEQLWLAFVMKERFKKTWDGEEWINLPSKGN